MKCAIALVLLQAASILADPGLGWEPKDPDSGQQLQWAEDMVNSMDEQPIAPAVKAVPERVSRHQRAHSAMLRLKARVEKKQQAQEQEFEAPALLGHFLGLKEKALPKMPSAKYSTHWNTHKKLGLRAKSSTVADDSYINQLESTASTLDDAPAPRRRAAPRKSAEELRLEAESTPDSVWAHLTASSKLSALDEDATVEKFPNFNWGETSDTKRKAPAQHEAAAVQENTYLSSVGWKAPDLLNQKSSGDDNPYMEAFETRKMPKISTDDSHEKKTYLDDVMPSKDWIMLAGA